MSNYNNFNLQNPNNLNLQNKNNFNLQNKNNLNLQNPNNFYRSNCPEKKVQNKLDFKSLKNNTICSLNEVECFLNKLQNTIKYIKIYKLLK